MSRTLPILCLLVACDGGFSDPSREYGEPVPEGAPLHPVTVHQPSTLGVVDTPLEDVHGAPVGVSCETCHGPSPERSWVADPGGPDTFHTKVDLQHGQLACNACHDEDRTKLHLADGTQLDFTRTMDLCAQCHGPQARDYAHGSHGGMNGYWDRRRGPRERNHCADCHAPHQPAYEPVMPVHPPRDRGLHPEDH